MSNLISEYLPVSETLKTQIEFSANENNNTSAISILPDRNTALKTQLESRFPGSLILSSLEMNYLELRVKISSVDEYVYPKAVIDQVDSQVALSRALLQSWWSSERKQLNIIQQISPAHPQRNRGELVLLNKGVSESYYLEEFLSAFTSLSAYAIASEEQLFISLFDAGYGLMQNTDSVLFTGVFTHYLSVIE